MPMKQIKSISRDVIIDIFAGLLISIGIHNFAINAHFPMTGVSGISLLLYQLYNLPIGLMTLLINIPIGISCYRILGRVFFLRSIKSLFITSFMIDYIAPLFPTYDGERLLAALCTGVFTGLGYGIIYANNSSTGGVDFINMSIRIKNPHISLGKIAFILDASIVLIGGAIYRDIDGVIYGLIVSFILSNVIDKLLYGVDVGKMTLIVTDKGKEMADMIYQISGRGATLLHGVGSYSNKQKDVVMCACNNKQMYQIKQSAKHVDPYSFTVIVESNEVVGQGFKSQ